MSGWSGSRTRRWASRRAQQLLRLVEPALDAEQVGEAAGAVEGGRMLGPEALAAFPAAADQGSASERRPWRVSTWPRL